MNSIRTWSLAANSGQTKAKEKSCMTAFLGICCVQVFVATLGSTVCLDDKPPWHGSPVGMDKFEQIRPDLQEEEKQCDHRPQGEHGGKQSDVLEELGREQSDLNLSVHINTKKKNSCNTVCMRNSCTAPWELNILLEEGQLRRYL